MRHLNYTRCLGAALALTFLSTSIPGASNLALAQSSAPQSTASSTPAYGNCPAPSTAGVNVCFPREGDIDSPMQVIASGTGAGGPVKYMELFIDGKKLEQVQGNLFDLKVTLPVGSHRVVLVELDSTGGFVKSNATNVNVQTDTSNVSCSAPGSAGVTVCMPSPTNCQVSSFTTVVAAGSSPSGTAVSRMELWVNGAKLVNSNGNFLDTNLAIPVPARFVIQEVDTKGGVTKSAPIVVQPC